MGAGVSCREFGWAHNWDTQVSAISLLPVWLRVSVRVLGFPFFYLLNIESVERAVLPILPDTQMLVFFTALNGGFWGAAVVSIGLLIYRRVHRRT